MKSERRGTTCVEFAIVAPIFFLLVFAMLEFGRFVMIQQQLTGAATAGARAAAFDGATFQSVNAAIKSDDRNLIVGLRNVDVVCNPNPPSSASYGQSVTVTVSTKFRDNSWLPLPQWLGSKSISATATARREAVQ
jgi:Flp pilus assembly protein TadG